MPISPQYVDLSTLAISGIADPVSSNENIFEPGFEISYAIARGLELRFGVAVDYDETLDALVFEAEAVGTPTQTNFVAPGSHPLAHAESLLARVADDISMQLSVASLPADANTWRIRHGMSLTAVAGGALVGTGFFLSIHATIALR